MGDLLLIPTASFDHALDIYKSKFLLYASLVSIMQQHKKILFSFDVQRLYAPDANSICYNEDRGLQCLYVTLLTMRECYI